MAFKADLHVHSDNSRDGRSSLDKLAAAAKARGLDAIAVTDHNVFTLRSPETRDGVLLLPGCEISSAEGHHILALFCREPFDVLAMRNGSALPSAAEVTEAIHAHGGVAVLAHPFGKSRNDCSPVAPLIDAAEHFNARGYFKNPEANDMAADFIARFELPETGGSDTHHASEVGNCYTVSDGDTAEAFETALREGKTRGVFVRNTPHLNKGFSQFARRLRSGRPLSIAKGCAYLVYCALLDIFKRS
ncbi:MAG: PHP domain-containing protein [Oscillospiraceae bacterium]|nr:PHP domain-containing protein [Oscillospiraceae bacterium]